MCKIPGRSFALTLTQTLGNTGESQLSKELGMSWSSLLCNEIKVTGLKAPNCNLSRIHLYPISLRLKVHHDSEVENLNSGSQFKVKDKGVT